jgi:uncharacterized protein (TIGR03437 family)
MYPINHARSSCFLRLLIHAFCGFLAQALLAPLCSSADLSPWALLAVHNTGYNQNLAAVSQTGPVYLTDQTCPAPTITLGDSSHSASCVTKTDVSGNLQFETQIGGAFAPNLVLGSDASVYVTGDAGREFATTPGVYEPRPSDATDPFVCKLDAIDGHALFCTFVDVADLGRGTFVVDSSGNSYLAGLCGSDFAHTCIEKLSSDGGSLTYRTTLEGNTPNQIAVDAYGNLFVLYGLPLTLVKFDAGGSLLSSVSNIEVRYAGGPYFLSLDPTGNPEFLIVLQGNGRIVSFGRYKADMSGPVFMMTFSIGSLAVVAQWVIDSTGVADIIGLTSGADIPLVHPTEVCSQRTDSSLPVYPKNEFFIRIGNDGQILQSTYLPSGLTPFNGQAFITANPTGATVLVSDYAESTFKALDVGPTNTEITLACIGNAASFGNLPLAPYEIVSLFGTTLGPTEPFTGQPDADGLYPSQLGGVQVTFDGTLAPILYASSGQLNVVTPGALAGKTTSHVCVIFNAQMTNCIDAIVQPAAPGVFQSQKGYAAAVNQDGTLNSLENPAAIGSIISIFVTGLGTMTPTPPDGSLVLPLLPVQDLAVEVSYARTSPDGQSPAPPGSADLLYAGPAPFEVTGVGQINVRVPIPAGLSHRFLTFGLGVTFPDGKPSFSSNEFTIWWTAPESSSAH